MYLVFGRLNASAGDYGPHAHGNVSASVMLAMASFSACLGATSASAAAAVESVMDLSDAQYADMSAQAHATWARMSDAQRQYREFVDGLVALEG